MTFSIQSLVEEANGQQVQLHEKYLNEQMPKVLRTIGFDKNYVRAEGAYLIDSDGKKYLDLLSGFGAFNFGRYHPTLVKAVEETLKLQPPTLVQMDTPLLAGIAAEQLVKKAPSKIEKVFFANSGTETVEAAIKFCRQATGRNKIVFIDHAFHGLTLGSLSLNNSNEFRQGFGPLLQDCVSVPLNDIEALEDQLSQKDVAAFIFEPIQGKGVYVPTNDYLQTAQALCQKFGTKMVADEVQAGMGRTGKFFAFAHYGIETDMVLLSKSLSGGMVPCGAVLMTKEICNKTFSRMDRCLIHSSTFKMNSLAMACVLASLHIIEEEGILENAQKRGEQFRKGLEAMLPKYEFLGEIRGVGLMIGIEFKKPKSFKLKMNWKLINNMNRGLFSQLIVIQLMEKFGILTQVAGHQMDVVKLLPPLVITEEQVDQVLHAFEEILKEVHKVHGPIWSLGTSLIKHSLKQKGSRPTA